MNTAIALTDDQNNANTMFLDFLISDDNFFVIKGAAGTGKSFLIRHLLETFHAKYKAYCLLLEKDAKPFDIRITATTNKAVSVVQEFLEDLLRVSPNMDICTIYSLLGLKVNNNTKTGKTELTYNKHNASASFAPDVTPLVFIDEAFFIGEDLHKIISSVLKDQANAKIVYIGDEYQLAPVGQDASPIDGITCEKASLTEVMRNSGHILYSGTKFRQTVEDGIFKPIEYNGTDVVHANGTDFQQLVEQSFSDPGWNTGVSKILAWTNARVQEYNQHIRQSMNRPVMLEQGEAVVTNIFIKGNTNFSRSVDSEVEITRVDPVPVTQYGVQGRMLELDGDYVGFMPDNFQEVKDLLNKLAKDKDWKKFFEIKENWLDLRAAYASSIHKSQGSTYDTVFLDLTDIGKNWNANDVARLMYVGITRAAKKVVCYGHLPDQYC